MTRALALVLSVSALALASQTLTTTQKIGFSISAVDADGVAVPLPAGAYIRSVTLSNPAVAQVVGISFLNCTIQSSGVAGQTDFTVTLNKADGTVLNKADGTPLTVTDTLIFTGPPVDHLVLSYSAPQAK